MKFDENYNVLDGMTELYDAISDLNSSVEDLFESAKNEARELFSSFEYEIRKFEVTYNDRLSEAGKAWIDELQEALSDADSALNMMDDYGISEYAMSRPDESMIAQILKWVITFSFNQSISLQVLESRLTSFMDDYAENLDIDTAPVE